MGFDNSGPAEIVDHKVSGFLASAYDVSQLSQGVAWCCTNGKLKDEDIERIRGRFSSARAAADYLELYSTC